MTKEPITVYGCPFCDATVRGPPNNPKLGPHNLQTHVKSKHTDKYDEFMKTPIANYEVDEVLPEEEVNTETPPPPPAQFQTFQQPVLQKIEIPINVVPTPDEWISQFLKTQASVKDKFIGFMQQRVRLYNELPDPVDLENDLKRMDSGVKNDTEAYYIRQFYEAALDAYLSQVQVDRSYGSQRGIRMSNQQQQPVEYHRGIQVGRREYETYPEPTPRSYRGGAPSSWMEDELMRLREDAKRRDDEDRRRQDRENAELKAQLIALQQQLQTGGGGNTRLEQKLEQLEADRRRMEEQYAQLKENTLLDKMRGIEAIARSGPSSEEIKAWLKDTVGEYRNQLMVEKNIEDMVEKKLQIHGRMGPSQTEVEMEKARNDLSLGVKKLEIEEKKAAQWGDTLKNVAGVFGEGIGKGMAGKQQPQGQGQQTPGTTCPHCGTPLMLPQNVRYGMCPNCNGKIEVDADGIPQKYIEQQPVQSPTGDANLSYAPSPSSIDVTPTHPAPGVETAQQKYRRKKPQSEAPKI